MKKSLKIITIFFALTAVLGLMGCEKAGLVIKNGPAGPKTKDLLKPLPKGLIADEENARHGNDDLKPQIN